MVSKEEFRNYVGELVKDDEDIRNQKKEPKSTGVTFLLVIVCTFMFFTVVLAPVAFAILLISAINGEVNRREKKKVENKYKDQLLKFLLKDQEYVFNMYSGIDSSIYRESPMYSYFDKYQTEDYLKIAVSNNSESTPCYLQLCDLYASETVRERQDDGTYEEREEVKFNGTFGYIEFKESFKAYLYVNCYSKISNTIQRVKLEDINFNKKFSIYSNDQIEARYILTPKVMDLLDKLNDKVSGKKSSTNRNVRIGLIGNKMYFGFRGGFKLFEINSYYNNINEVFDDFYDDIEIILSLCEEIKNNYKIFKI